MTRTTRPWSQPTEIPLEKLPSRRGAPGLYDTWINDVLLRLEQTRKSALAYTFVSEEEAAKHIKTGINKIRNRYGNSYVRAQRRDTIVYVYRGPNWYNPSDKVDTTTA